MYLRFTSVQLGETIQHMFVGHQVQTRKILSPNIPSLYSLNWRLQFLPSFVKLLITSFAVGKIALGDVIKDKQ